MLFFLVVSPDDCLKKPTKSPTTINQSGSAREADKEIRQNIKDISRQGIENKQ